MRTAAFHINLRTWKISVTLINYVLRQHTSIATDIELTIVKLTTGGIFYHIDTYPSWQVIYEKQEKGVNALYELKMTAFKLSCYPN